MNLQIRVENVVSLYAGVTTDGARIALELEEKWYRIGEEEYLNASGVRLTAQLCAEKRGGVGHSRQGDGDVIEEDAVDQAQPVKTSWAASSERSMP